MRSKIKQIIDDSTSILLLTHESPDGDAIGSLLAFYHYLSSINKTVDMVVSNVPKIFDFLPSIDKIVDNTDKKYDLAIVLDCATKERISQKEDLLSNCKKTICIDHHISNTNFCDVNFIDGEVSSCCQVVYYLFKEWNINFNKYIGECLVTGVLTDTNGFGINTVDVNTFNMAADMLNLGIDIHNIYQKVLWTKTKSQYELMKIAIDRLEFYCDGKIAFTYVLEDDFNRVNAILGEHEGIVDIGRNIEGVEVSIFIRENNGWTISFRSTGTIDVNKIASAFGGGGHKMAAGAKLDSSFKETKDRIIEETKKVLFQ